MSTYYTIDLDTPVYIKAGGTYTFKLRNGATLTINGDTGDHAERVSAIEDSAVSIAQELRTIKDRLDRYELARMAALELTDNNGIAINGLTNELSDLRNYVYTKTRPGSIEYLDGRINAIVEIIKTLGDHAEVIDRLTGDLR